MAFPDNIKSSGSLSLAKDLAEYFRWSCGLQTVAPNNNTPLNDANPEGWPFIIDAPATHRQFMVQDESVNPSGINMYTRASTITRKQFYDYIDFWSNRPGTTSEKRVGFFSQDINGMGLYYYDTPEPNTVWSLKQLNDWGKIKTLELMFFKSAGDDEFIPEGEGSTGEYLNDLMIMAPNWSSNDALYRLVNHLITTTQLTSSLEYLRCGLTRFEDYEGYNNDILLPSRPAPSNLIADTLNRVFTFTPVPHFLNWSCYEYSFNSGGSWSKMFANEVPVPSGGVPIGGLIVRLASDGVYPAGNTITNDTAIIPSPVEISVYCSWDRTDVMEYSLFIDAQTNQVLDVLLTINLILQPDTNWGDDTPQYVTMKIYPGETSSSDVVNVFEPNGYGNINSVVATSITVAPNMHNGLPINVYFYAN